MLKTYLSFLQEKTNKDFFDYSQAASKMWNNILIKAKKEFGVYFDTENNDSIKEQRVIDIPQDQWEHTECKFRCELFQAGGDWEVPIYYFRCQLVKGYAYNLGTYSTSHFIYIPGKEEGNDHLWFEKDKWHAPNNDGYKKGIDPEPDKRKCWESLKIYLKDLVDLEIEKIRSEREEE